MGNVDSKITIKLLIDAHSQKVLFGEAGKDFVDFIFSLLTLPLGSVINLLSPPTMIGSIGKLYQSVENLNDAYFVTNKSSLLHPKVSSFNYVASPLLLGTEAITELKCYLCNFCKIKMTSKRNIMCPNCKQMMANEVSFVAPSVSHFSSSSGAGNGGDNDGGFVKGVVTYMITDDLEVTPMSAISTITLMNRFSIKKEVQLKVKVVVVGMTEGLALLKASLESTTALTDVFCPSHKKAEAQPYSLEAPTALTSSNKKAEAKPYSLNAIPCGMITKLSK